MRYRFLKPEDVPHLRVHNRGYLPHWELPGFTYLITFRLADSLPKHVTARLIEEKLANERTLTNGTRELTVIEHMQLRREFDKRLDEALHEHHGAAYMEDPKIARLVANAIKFFEDQRYRLYAWCVMPNHVHVLMQPLGVWTVEGIVHSWKSWSANQVNYALRRKGRLWAREYWDRIMRDDEELEEAERYVVNNPVKAGLEGWRWVSAGWKPAVRPAGSRRS